LEAVVGADCGQEQLVNQKQVEVVTTEPGVVADGEILDEQGQGRVSVIALDP
jgi:hypothetical protein